MNDVVRVLLLILHTVMTNIRDFEIMVVKFKQRKCS